MNLVERFTNKAIAIGLCTSEVMTKKHAQSIIAKLDACVRSLDLVKAITQSLAARSVDSFPWPLGSIWGLVHLVVPAGRIG